MSLKNNGLQKVADRRLETRHTEPGMVYTDF